MISKKENYIPMILIKKPSDLYNTLKSYFKSDDNFCYFYDENNESINKLDIDLGKFDRNIILIYNMDNESNGIDELFWCAYKKEVTKKNSKPYLKCKKLYESKSEIVIENICNNALLELEKDFQDTFIVCEYLPDIYYQFSKLEEEYNPYNNKKNTIEYESIKSEESLHELAQRNEYCLRENYVSLPTPDGRGEYQRDYDRIIHSKSFRRMADKTQIFTSSKGAYYRTRMTHTMVVCQIARSISDALNLNSSLTEAIALGHDLGHTPFGHVGERALSKKCNDIGGFKHNYQSVRVASLLDNQYIDCYGLDLSYQVMEGMFKHTKMRSEINHEKLFSKEIIEQLHMEYKHSTTLEGQVVALADEIAQRSHDIDDAFTSNLLSKDELLKYLKLNKFENLNNDVIKIREKLNKADEFIIVDRDEIFSSELSSLIVGYFINDVINKSKVNIEKYLEKNSEDFKETHLIKQQVINFSEDGALICKSLEKILTNKILNSNEVSLADKKSENIINCLFDTYYNNPQLLHIGTRKMIYIEFIANMKNGGHIKNVIDIVNGNQKAINKEFKKIIETNTNNDYEIIEKREILKRKICDYIAGMTDKYALNEYENICN